MYMSGGGGVIMSCSTEGEIEQVQKDCEARLGSRARRVSFKGNSFVFLNYSIIYSFYVIIGNRNVWNHQCDHIFFLY